MNRVTRNVCLFAAALALGVFALREARAGNYTNTAALYYSVELSPGQFFYSSDSRIILIDDITYSIKYQPCGAESACDFFTTGDIPDMTTTTPTGPTIPSSGLAMW